MAASYNGRDSVTIIIATSELNEHGCEKSDAIRGAGWNRGVRSHHHRANGGAHTYLHRDIPVAASALSYSRFPSLPHIQADSRSEGCRCGHFRFHMLSNAVPQVRQFREGKFEVAYRPALSFPLHSAKIIVCPIPAKRNRKGSKVQC